MNPVLQQNPITADPLMRISEVAQYIRSSDKTVRRLITAGQLRSVKVRGLRLIRQSDLMTLLQTATQ